MEKQKTNTGCHFDCNVRSKVVPIWFKKYLRKHFTAPSSHCGEKSWSQISGWVDGATAVEPKSGGNDEHQKTNNDRCHPPVGRIVVLVYDGEDTADKKSRAEQLKSKADQIKI